MDSVFQWDRPIPADTVRALARLAPRVDRASHLVCFWESGTPATPVQRYEIYEATPIALVGPWKLRAFHADPVCRCAFEAAELSACPRCGGMQSPGRQRIADYLHRTECLALPFWIVQGEHGGHRHRHTETEKSWARLMGLPEDPPAPGDLPFVLPDERVWRKIRQYDRTKRAHQHLADAYAEDQKAAGLAFRSALADYTDTAVEHAMDGLSLPRKAALVDHLPRNFTQDRRTVDTAAARDTFIQGTV